MQLKWKINLVGYGEGASGDVVTKDGEILGRWVLDAEDHPNFIPDGSDTAIFMEPFVFLFCDEVAKWHESRSTG